MRGQSPRRRREEGGIIERAFFTSARKESDGSVSFEYVNRDHCRPDLPKEQGSLRQLRKLLGLSPKHALVDAPAERYRDDPSSSYSMEWMRDRNLPYRTMLNQLLVDRSTRNELINELMRCNAPHCVQVRFCVAVDEFLGTADAREKQAKGRRIVEMFASDSGPFKCCGIAPHVQDRLEALLKQRKPIPAAELARARHEVASELSKLSEVKQAIVKVFGAFKQDS